MARNLRVPRRDQAMLFPVDLREWLPENDLVWFVLDVVEQMDLAEFYARLRVNGQGGAAYDPAMMVALLVYANAVGVNSSRSIERACTRDAGFKVVTGLLQPDHSTISRFLKDNQALVKSLFVQVLRLCRQAGMARLGVISIDGTKIAANASWAKSYTAAALDHQIAETQAEITSMEQAIERNAARLVAEQVALDEAEDARHGPDGGGPDEDLPASLRSKTERLEKIKRAKADLDERDRQARESMLAEQKAKQADYDAKVAAGNCPGGRRPKDEVAYGAPRRRDKATGEWIEPAAPRASVTDPDSRRMKAKHGYLQGYNAQVGVTEDQIIVGFHVSQHPTDHHQYRDVMNDITTNMSATRPARPQQQTDQQTEDVADVDDELDDGQGENLEEVTDERIETELAAAAARVDDTGVLIADAGYANEQTFQQAEDDGITMIAPLASDERLQQGEDPAGGQDLTDRPATRRAQQRLRTPTGRDLYKLRGQTSEPVNGQLKDRRHLRQFATRGLQSVTAEFALGATVHNLMKLFNHHQAPPTPA